MALFTVSKQVAANARVAFFDENTIRMTSPLDVAFRKELRSVVLDGDYAKAIRDGIPKGISGSDEFLKMPKLSNLTVVADDLPRVAGMIRNSPNMEAHWKSVTFTSLGSFELELKPGLAASFMETTHGSLPKICFRDFQLLELISKGKDLAAKNNDDAISKQLQQMNQPNLRPAMSLNTPIRPDDYDFFTFGRWLLAYEKLRALRSKPNDHGLGSPSVSDAEMLARHMAVRCPAARGDEMLPKELLLADSSAGQEHSPELLERACEVLTFVKYAYAR